MMKLLQNKWTPFVVYLLVCFVLVYAVSLPWWGPLLIVLYGLAEYSVAYKRGMDAGFDIATKQLADEITEALKAAGLNATVTTRK
jgi:hypothetical protein